MQTFINFAKNKDVTTKKIMILRFMLDSEPEIFIMFALWACFLTERPYNKKNDCFYDVEQTEIWIAPNLSLISLTGLSPVQNVSLVAASLSLNPLTQKITTMIFVVLQG